MILINSRLTSVVATNAITRWQSLSRSYGRFIAEFLNASFPVRLGLLDHPTGVGLRYGFRKLCERWFSWRRRGTHSTPSRGTFGVRAQLKRRISLPLSTLCALHVQSMRTLRSSHPVTPLLNLPPPFSGTCSHHPILACSMWYYVCSMQRHTTYNILHTSYENRVV